MLFWTHKRPGRFGLALLLLAGVVTWLGCGRKAAEGDAVLPDSAVTILQPTTAGAEGWYEIVSDLFPKAESFAVQDIDDALAHSIRKNSILLVTDPEFLPQQDWADLTNHLQDGGEVLFLGVSPFERRARWVNEELEPESDRWTDLIRSARSVSGFSSVQSWRHRNESGRLRGILRAANTVGIPLPGVEVVVRDFRQWDAMVQSTIPTAVTESDDNTFVFYARGSEVTSRLVLVGRESDGSHWYRVLPVGEKWQRFVVREESLSYFYGGSGRGGEDDRFSIQKMDQLTIGLSMHLAPQAEGNHVFSLSDVQLVKDERTEEQALAWPDVAMVAPPERHYDMQPTAVQVVGQSEKIQLGDTRMQSPYPLGRGLGGTVGAGHRWIPMARAYDSRGELLGWPAAVYFDADQPNVICRWGWIGARATEATTAACHEMLQATLRRMYGGAFLYSAGSSQSSFNMGETIEVTARWYEGDQMDVPLRIAAEFLARDGHVLRKVVSTTALGESGGLRGPVSVRLAKAPQLRQRAEPYTIRVVLEDASGNGDIYDQVLQPIMVVPLRDHPKPEDWVRVEQSYFQYQFAPFFAMGVEYAPGSVQAAGGGVEAEDWLHPARFDPELVERDLDLLQKLRVNAISFPYTHALQAPQLRYVIEAAREREIFLVLQVDGLSPLQMDFEKARTLIEAANLRSEPNVFAIEVARDLKLGRRVQRRALDPAWRRWLVEQYGSLKKAQMELGSGLTIERGLIVGPSDLELAKDGEHRWAVATYRRFLDDYVSRRFGEVRRFVKKTLGCPQLLTTRAGYEGVGNPYANADCPVDLATGAIHLDFMSPSAAHLMGDKGEFYSAAFLTAYGRGVSGGKPVVWTEFGANLGRHPTSVDYANQARIFVNLFDMVSRSISAGCFAWWYPGGYNVQRGYDMGVVHPDGLPREAGLALRNYANNLRSVRPEIPAWTGREFFREADARGLSALWELWKRTYAEELAANRMVEIRPVGFGKLTTEMPMVAVDKSPVKGREPLLCANAEWGGIREGDRDLERSPGETVSVTLGKRLDLQLLNTGAATWAASKEGQSRTVWVIARHEEKRTEKFRLRAVPFGRSTSISWLPTVEGLWEVRPWISRVGPIGEVLRIQVEPESSSEEPAEAR